MEFTQWIPTKHIPKFRVVRIPILVIVFWRLKWRFSRFFKFKTLITRKLSILKKNQKSNFLIIITQKTYKNVLKLKK